GKGGFYRALVVMAGDKAAIANVYLQWLSFGDAAKPTIVKSIPVKEITTRISATPRSRSAERRTRRTRPRSSLAPTMSKRIRTSRFSSRRPNPGTYTIAKAPPEGAEQAPGQGAPQAAPQSGAPSEGKAPAKGEKPGVED